MTIQKKEEKASLKELKLQQKLELARLRREEKERREPIRKQKINALIEKLIYFSKEVAVFFSALIAVIFAKFFPIYRDSVISGSKFITPEFSFDWVQLILSMVIALFIVVRVHKKYKRKLKRTFWERVVEALQWGVFWYSIFGG